MNSRHGLQRHQPFGLVCAYGLDQGIYVNPFLRESHPFQPLDQSLGALRHGLRAFRKAGVVHAEGDDLTFLTAKEGHHGFPALGLQTYAVDDGGLVCQRISLLQHRWGRGYPGRVADPRRPGPPPPTTPCPPSRALSEPRRSHLYTCLLYTSDAADEEDSVDL